MQLSKYQEKIEEVYINTNDNIVVQAAPGSGKTTTLVRLSKITLPSKRAIFICFNKSIQQELEKRIPSFWSSYTLHSLGYKILRDNLVRSYKVEENKTFKLLMNVIDKKKFTDSKKYYGYLGNLSNLIDLCRMNLCLDQGEERIQLIADLYGFSTINGEIKDVMKFSDYLEIYNSGNHKQFLIDFTDMLWLPYKLIPEFKYPKYAVVFIDECQDLNPLQKQLVDRIISKNGRFISVGDKRQAIYNFAGSNLKSFEEFENFPNTQILPLSVSYRCAKNIIQEANFVFDGVESAESAEEGIVRKGNIYEAEHGDYILCRNNLPLIESYFEIIVSGKKAKILGKDYHVELIKILDLIPDDNEAEEIFRLVLFEKYSSIKKRYPDIQNPTYHSGYVQLQEKISILKFLKGKTGSFIRVRDILNDAFVDEQSTDYILLTTIHKAKGLEADRVFILYPQLIPSKFALSAEDFYAEKCLLYVAITRAKKELVYIDMESKSFI